MSIEENKSFWDEIQEKYKIEGINYTPACYLEVGMVLTFVLGNKELRPDCPLCGERSNIHEYIPKVLKFGTINGTVNFEIKHCRYAVKLVVMILWRCLNIFLISEV